MLKFIKYDTYMMLSTGIPPYIAPLTTAIVVDKNNMIHIFLLLVFFMNLSYK
jgi:hypothetical protein